jgi:hypothetical protein
MLQPGAVRAQSRKVIRVQTAMDAATRAGIGSWHGSNNSVFVVLVAPNAPGSSTLLARPTLSCSATKSLCCMFAPITQEHEH